MREIPNLSSRQAAATDDPFLLELYTSTRADELAMLNLSEPQKHAFMKMQFEAQRRCYPPADHQIICLQGRPVGRTLIKRSEDNFLLVDISLVPEARNQGFGAYLVRQLMDEAACQRKAVKLRVMVNNPARRLYERLGFTIVNQDLASPGAQAYLEMIWSPSNSS